MEFVEWLVALFSNIPKLFYFLYTSLASLVDLCQYLFRQIAGLETMYVNNAPIEGDLVSHFLIGIITGKYPILQTLFWSMVILGIIFLFVTSIIAIIKTEANSWTEENKKGEKKVANGKGKVFANAGRALIRMAVVPITCIFACYFGGVVLNAIEGATTVSQTSSYLSEIKVTSSSDPTITYDAFKKNRNGTYFHYDIFGISLESNQISFSGIAFKTVMHGANRVRSTDWFITDVIYAADTKDGETGNFGVFNQAVDQESCALLIDEVFANNAILNNDYAGKKLDIEKGKMSDLCRPGVDFFSDYDEGITQFSKFNVGLVSYYYDLWKFNIIIGFAYMILMFSMFYKIVFGLVKRLIYTMVLYLTLPAFCGLSPLDSGEAYKNWKKAYVKEFLNLFGTVAAMNLFLIILPYLEGISFFPASNRVVALINKLVGMLFTLVGLTMVKDFSGLISGFFGGGDVVASGDAALKGAKDLGDKSIGSIAKIGGGLAKVGAGVFVAGKGIGSEIAQKTRENRFKKEEKTKDALQKDINKQVKETKDRRKAEQELLEQRQKNTAAGFEIGYEGQQNNIKDEANRDIQTYKQEAEQKKQQAKQDYIDRFMANEDPEKLKNQEYAEKRRQYYAERYDGLKGTKNRNEQIDAEMNRKIAERETKRVEEGRKLAEETRVRREQMERRQKQEREAFERETQRQVQETAREQKEQIKAIKKQQEDRIKKQQDRELRRARFAEGAGKVYKYGLKTPLQGILGAGSGMLGGLGLGGGGKKDKK